MALVARAPRLSFQLTITTKNFLIVLMCVIFLVLFVRDGYMGYPQKDDEIVTYMKKMTEENPPTLSPEYRPELDQWKGWNNESAAARQRMDEIANIAKTRGAGVEGWKASMDIAVQRWLTLLLVVATAWSIWRFVRFLRLRVIADDQTVSPASGVMIPWEKITCVDNTRWRSLGIVDITYDDQQGRIRHAKFDEYELEREPLLTILEQLADKAGNAEFIPKEEGTSAAEGSASETGATGT